MSGGIGRPEAANGRIIEGGLSHELPDQRACDSVATLHEFALGVEVRVLGEPLQVVEQLADSG
jgi:hypothetical protein